MAQENTHDAKMAALQQHKQAHIAYWKDHGNRPTDPQRFEDGFIQGWCDCENPDYPDINRDSMLNQRQGENVNAKGNSDCEWAFGDGYHEGFDARCEYHKQTFDTHPEKMKECEQHKQAHIKYWQEHGNRKTDIGRFEAGFIAGWCDAENNRWPCITRDTLLCHRQDQNVQQCGQSDCEWAFGDGYHEGFDSRRCYKPPQQQPQQPACPPAAPPTQPAQPPQQQQQPPANPPSHTVPPTQPPSQPNQPVQPPSQPVQPPPSQPPAQPPSQPTPSNQPPAPAHTQVPEASHTCNEHCNHAPDFCCTISCTHGPDHTCSDSCVHPQTRHCTKSCHHKILHRCTQNCSHELNDWCTIECSHGQHECSESCYHPTTRHCHENCSHPKSHQCDNNRCDHVPNYYCTVECNHGRHECSERCNHPKTRHCGEGCRHEGWMIMRQISAVQITEVITVTEVVQVEYVEVDESETIVEGHECTEECKGKHKKKGFFHKVAEAMHIDLDK